jgi:transposase
VKKIVKEMVEELDKNFEYINHEIKGNRIIIRVKSKRVEVVCPYCGQKSKKVYSKYKRKFQDLPIQGKTVMIEIESRKLFCNNTECDKKTFVERFDCIAERRRQTNRLEKKIIEVSKHTSSITAAGIFREMGIKIGKSTICLQLKKNSVYCRP